MKNRTELQKYFKNKYYNKNNNYKLILSKIKKEENINSNKLLKTVATIIITLLGTTSIVFASATLANKYIKKQAEINSLKLSTDEEGVIYYEVDLTQNDMIWNEENSLNYKIITNNDDYIKYKTRLEELPEMSDQDFKENFLVIIENGGYRQPHETDLEIFNVEADEKNTYIIMKQKDNPNYENNGKVWYAVVSNEILRENIELKILHKDIKDSKFISLDKLPSEYSIDDALADGCIVEENYRIISEDPLAIDKFIERSKNGEESSIRIYSLDYDTVIIMDLAFDGKNYLLSTLSSTNKSMKLYSFKCLEKTNSNDHIMYVFKRETNYIEGVPLLILEQN